MVLQSHNETASKQLLRICKLSVGLPHQDNNGLAKTKKGLLAALSERLIVLIRGVAHHPTIPCAHFSTHQRVYLAEGTARKLAARPFSWPSGSSLIPFKCKVSLAIDCITIRARPFNTPLASLVGAQYAMSNSLDRFRLFYSPPCIPSNL